MNGYCMCRMENSVKSEKKLEGTFFGGGGGYEKHLQLLCRQFLYDHVIVPMIDASHFLESDSIHVMKSLFCVFPETILSDKRKIQIQ